MGFSLACAIAQSTTWQLLNFDRRSEVFTCIDNVAFAGSVRDVTEDVTNFLRRCSLVGATLNEVSQQQILEFLDQPDDRKLRQVKNWHQDEFTFLGVKYNWVARTRAISNKTMDKFAAKRCLDTLGVSIAPRQLATLIGILRYASMVSDVTVFDKFDLMAWSRRVGAYLQEDLRRWDLEPLVFPADCKSLMLEWFANVLRNTPVAIAQFLPRTVPTTLITDASGNGWGAVRVNADSYETAQGVWRSEIRSSVRAEPEGVLQAAYKLIQDEDRLVLVLTDHKPLVYASQSIAPRSFYYNELLRKLKLRFPNTRFIFQFLPGVDNVADAMSRNQEEQLDIVKARRFAGMGWSTALSYIVNGPLCLKCLSPTLPWQV
eukprot:GILI01006019.1.p1 GENE.GILI01006019.1~~GILI01006019.1.p1  ORF type:complete len:374 (-),score=7.55 GILI01006019.1:427-1548(-)